MTTASEICKHNHKSERPTSQNIQQEQYKWLLGPFDKQLETNVCDSSDPTSLKTKPTINLQLSIEQEMSESAKFAGLF